jgi:hypothetical protein
LISEIKLISEVAPSRFDEDSQLLVEMFTQPQLHLCLSPVRISWWRTAGMRSTNRWATLVIRNPWRTAKEERVMLSPPGDVTKEKFFESTGGGFLAG